MRHCIVIDDFLAEPQLERRRALNASYKNVEHNGLNYPGIAEDPDPVSEDKIRTALEVQGGAFTSFWRKYLPEAEQNTFIHNDVKIGIYSGILFLTDDTAAKGGLAFWQHKAYGWYAQPPNQAALDPLGLDDTPELWDRIHQDGMIEKRWVMLEYVPMKFNRLVLFCSDRYHSRYPKTPIGEKIDDCRLIKVFFWLPSEEKKP